MACNKSAAGRSAGESNTEKVTHAQRLAAEEKLLKAACRAPPGSTMIRIHQLGGKSPLIHISYPFCPGIKALDCENTCSTFGLHPITVECRPASGQRDDSNAMLFTLCS